ncbi:MAG TPA: glucosaminidase domain-containing protein [Streptosporangiaceae bacterium]|nr:glucosaminidase domain-containing protein [Streptosporangiaceae bacterium]
MPTAGKAWWQQATALVSLGAGGAITGLSFVPQSAAELTSPASLPINLMALEHAARQGTASDATLRSAVINVAKYYLRMAESKTPAEIQAMIWQQDSLDGADHGASCAAFASMTLALGAHAVGQESWVSGGTTYPWPLHRWADVRVNPNPASPGVTSIVQDARAHDRWHGLGDGYQPQPGDWVVFDGHVEVVTDYSGGTLHTIGADSLPDFSVNAQEYPRPLGGRGVLGFVNNGRLGGAAARAQRPGGAAVGGQQANGQPLQAATAIPGTQPTGDPQQKLARAPGVAAIPGTSASAPGHGKRKDQVRRQAQQRPDGMAHGRRTAAGSRAGKPAAAGGLWVEVPGQAVLPEAAAADTAVIPGLPIMAQRLSAGAPAPSATPARSHDPSPRVTTPSSGNPQQAFIATVAHGAVAAQRKYGVPASVTIAQAIVESGWGESQLATQDHNLFGIKGTGPAGSHPLPTWEYVNGQQVTTTSQFRVYRNTAESIDDHGRLLATSPYYRRAMADRRHPDAFAASLTGVYATDPDYGAKLISLMKRYDLYRYDVTQPSGVPKPASSSTPAPGTPRPQVPHPRTPAAQAPPTPAPSRQAPAPDTSSAPPPSAGSPTPQVPAPQSPSPDAPASSPSPRAPGHQSPASTPGPSKQPAHPEHAGPQQGSQQELIIPGLPGAATPAAAATPRTGSLRGATPRRTGASTDDDPSPAAGPATQALSARRVPAAATTRLPRPRAGRRSARRYHQPLPPSVKNAFIAKAGVRLMRAEPIYRDVADHCGIPWQLLAASDWMQCGARPRYSPVHGERLGRLNPDGTSFRTKSAALEQCADDLIELAGAVYGIDLTAPGDLSVRELANVFAAFRWGGLLRLHRTSAMEFPYSVAGLTEQYSKMRWPNIDEPNTPDKPGGRFRGPFGAVPVVLSLDYPATV